MFTYGGRIFKSASSAIRLSYRRIADEQTLLKIRLPDVNITSNRLVLSG